MEEVEVVEIKREEEEKPEMVKEWERTKLAWEATYMQFTRETAQ